MDNFNQFLLWENSTRDTIDFKKIYVDMTGDLIAGLMLSQIIFWYLPDRNNKSKLRVKKDNKYWIAKGHNEWYEECRITEWQAPRALSILKEKGIVETKLYRFNGAPTIHIRIIYEKFIKLWQECMPRIEESEDDEENPFLAKDQNPFEGNARIDSSEMPESLTENTASITSDILVRQKKSKVKNSKPKELAVDITPADMNNLQKIDICKLFNINSDAVFITGLNPVVAYKFEELFNIDKEKCYRIAQHYANISKSFQYAIGKVVEYFDKWDTPKKPEEKKFALDDGFEGLKGQYQ